MVQKMEIQHQNEQQQLVTQQFQQELQQQDNLNENNDPIEAIIVLFDTSRSMRVYILTFSLKTIPSKFLKCSLQPKCIIPISVKEDQLDILINSWTPFNNYNQKYNQQFYHFILESTLTMLQNPNADCALDFNIASIYKLEPQLFKLNVLKEKLEVDSPSRDNPLKDILGAFEDNSQEYIDTKKELQSWLYQLQEVSKNNMIIVKKIKLRFPSTLNSKEQNRCFIFSVQKIQAKFFFIN